MAISRPFLLAVLGVVLLGATVLAVQSARNGTEADSAPAAIQADSSPTAPANTQAAPTDTLQSAFDLSQVHSARFSIKLTFKARDAATSVALRGAFDRAAAGGAPHYAVAARLGAAGKESVGGEFISLGDRAYFVRGDTGWRVPKQVWTADAQKQLQLDVHPASWLRDVKSEGDVKVGGIEMEHLSAKLDAQAMLNELGSATGGAARVSKAEAAAVKSSTVEVWVGKDDHVVRRMDAQLVLPRRARFGLELRLGDINKSQRIKAPADVRNGVPAGAVGPFADTLVRRINGVTGTDTASLEALTSPNPGRAARAVHRHKKVVILFTNKRGLDDRQMVSVVRDVDRRTKALVLMDPVDAVDRYGKLVQDLGVNETPSVVIIDSKGKARLVEGYVDSDTLTQAVTDAR